MLMENKFRDDSNYILFQRSGNPIKGLWQFLKNNLIIWQTFKYKLSIISLFVILLALLILLFVMAGVPLYVMIWMALAFTLLELTLYFLATKFAKPYKTNEVALGDNEIVFSDGKPGYKGKILYQEIQKISYSSQIGKMIIGGFFSELLRFTAFYLSHFVIEYKTNTGKENGLLIPLDLINLPDFLQTTIEKVGLKRVQPGKFSLYFEWQKLQPGEKVTSQEQEIRPVVIDPNADVGKLVLVVLIITIIISYFIIR